MSLAMFAASVNDTDIIDQKRKSHTKTQRCKSERVSSVLNTLRNNQFYEESNNDMGDFSPMEPPTSAGVEQTKLRDSFTSESTGKPSQQENPNNYHIPVYEAMTNSSINGFGTSSLQSSDIVQSNNDQGQQPEPETVVEKINYVITLLESQQDEKVSNVTEEVVLYFFLGIFIIFIVDSFVNVGRYIR
jgi:hypothetical protein